MTVKRRTHPVTIIFNLGRVFYLVVIPLARGFISAFRGGMALWVAGAWMDILVFLFMLALAALSWFTAYYCCCENFIRVSSGLLNRRDVLIPWKNVVTICVTEPFYLRPARALRFRADTLGGSYKSPDFTIFLSRARAAEMTSILDAGANSSPEYVYRPSTGSVVALSLLSSNSFGGVVFISAFISQSGRILGEEFAGAVVGRFEDFSRSLAFGLPPAAAAMGYILLAGWLVGFALSFFRYKDFTLARSNGILNVRGGVFTRREYTVRCEEINFADIRQSMASRLMRLSSLYISAVGYGKSKDDISCVIPAEGQTRFSESLGALFPDFSPAPPQVRPKSRNIARFLGAPVMALCAIGAGYLLFLRLFPSWGDFTGFVCLMAAIPAFLFLWVRAEDFRTGGAALDGETCVLRYSSRLLLHTVVIPRHKVVAVELRQSFLQKFGPYCDLIISTRAEGRSRHRCRGLLKQELTALFDLK